MALYALQHKETGELIHVYTRLDEYFAFIFESGERDSFVYTTTDIRKAFASLNTPQQGMTADRPDNSDVFSGDKVDKKLAKYEVVELSIHKKGLVNPFDGVEPITKYGYGEEPTDKVGVFRYRVSKETPQIGQKLYCENSLDIFEVSEVGTTKHGWDYFVVSKID